MPPLPGTPSPVPYSIVTGANVGIGLEVAAGLRQAGHHVVLACRSMDKCAAAKAALDARQLPGSCECRHLDLADFTSIRRFASEVEGQQAAVSRLVNNAGVMGVPPGAAGDDGHFLPNHLGPYLLTRLLLPFMAPRARIVNVASEAHHRGKLAVSQVPSSSHTASSSSREGSPRSSATTAATTAAGGTRWQLEGGSGGHWYGRYARSKLANVLFTAELSRRLQQRDSSVTAYSVSPGRVNTNIFHGVPGLLQVPLRWLAAAVFQTPQQGARTVLHAALAPELEGRHELYMHDIRPHTASPAARDAALAGQLWQLSNQEVGLSAAEDAALWPLQHK